MALNFSPGNFNEYLADLTGYKAGLALTLEELYDHLNGMEGYADIAKQSELSGIRLHSTEVESITYRLMHRVGYTDQEYDGDHTGVWRFHKYRKSGQLELYEKVSTIWIEMMPSMMEAVQKGTGGLDPSPTLRAALKPLVVLAWIWQWNRSKCWIWLYV
ncbi:hypothetical protein KIH13_12910 [Pseudomonas viridiflava]|nr:hypothetical protein KIH13_12910 [Pseudomonas viridiflava]